ncbi:rRNA maturation RNase YbeY [Roseivivax sp. CAU 1761]
MLTETILEDARWQAADLAALAERAAGAALVHLGLAPGRYEIAVLACDDARIATLNGEFRGKPSPTNVLSWPAWDLAAEAPGARPEPPPDEDPDCPGEPLGLGDMALAWETCAREAAESGKPLADHLTHLVVHGTLHLLGYDHVEDRDAALMEALECAILEELGIPNPYERDLTGEGPADPRQRPPETGHDG